MHILLLGKDNSITHTLNNMLDSVSNWATSVINSLATFSRDKQNFAHIDVIVANLDDFSISPTAVVHQITAALPETPLLVLHSYNHDFLIKPLLEAGAAAQLKLGAGEEKLFEAVHNISAN